MYDVFAVQDVSTFQFHGFHPIDLNKDEIDTNDSLTTLCASCHCKSLQLNCLVSAESGRRKLGSSQVSVILASAADFFVIGF